MTINTACRTRTMSLGSASLVLFVAAHARGAGGFQGLGFLPGSTQTIVTGLSGDGTTVVGTGVLSDLSAETPVRWRMQSGLVDLGAVSGSPVNASHAATGVSFDGQQIVGIADVLASRKVSLKTPTSYSLIDNVSTASARISPDGNTIFGQDDSGGYYWTQQGGRVHPGGVGAFNASSTNASTLVGYVGHIFGIDGGGNAIVGPTPVTWTQDTGTVALKENGQFVSGNATDISSDGSKIVGTLFNPNGTNPNNFIWTSATGFQRLGAAGGSAPSISGDGSTIAFGDRLWTQTDGIRSLNAILDSLGVSVHHTWGTLQITGISFDGTVLTGNALDPDGRGQGWIASIPAPGTGVAVAAGLPFLFRRQRGSKDQNPAL